RPGTKLMEIQRTVAVEVKQSVGGIVLVESESILPPVRHAVGIRIHYHEIGQTHGARSGVKHGEPRVAIGRKQLTAAGYIGERSGQRSVVGHDDKTGAVGHDLPEKIRETDGKPASQGNAADRVNGIE